jgi:hypothetical protein
MPDGRFTVTHSDWGEDPYGWQVRMDGEVLDTYVERDVAEAYAEYMNKRERGRVDADA